jgi:hypothetical protein
MPYCARCGVEVEREVRACPLCETPIPRLDDLPPASAAGDAGRRYPSVTAWPTGVDPLQLRLSVWATLSAIFLISMLVVLAANLVGTGWRITWSAFALGSIGLAWLIATVILVIFRPPWLVVLCVYPPVAGFLALTDALDSARGWFLTVGLPIATAVLLAFEVSTILWTVWKDRGANQLAILLLLLAPACSVIDFAISSYLGHPGLTWSFVVLGVLVPLAGFLFIYHYVLRRVLKLERIFHL